MHRILKSRLPIFLLAPALLAVEPTSWDLMRGTYAGVATLTTKNGKTIKATGKIYFTPDSVLLGTTSQDRQSVKEIVIRRPRGACCETLDAGLVAFALLIDCIENGCEPIPFTIIATPYIVGAAVGSGVPLLVIEGFRRLKPEPILYKVIP